MKVDRFSHAALWHRVFRIFGIAAVILLVAGLLLSPSTAAANPDHSAGDYFMFAKAAATGVGDRKANELTCDSSNHKQADVSGSNSDFYGRLHSNADIAISGSNNDFFDTSSPNPEITFGTHPGNCQSQADSGNNYASGGPTNINTNAYQVDLTTGWPGNLGNFLNTDRMTFGTNVTQVLPGASCNLGSLTNNGTIEIDAAHNGMVVCNGTGETKISVSGLGSAANPFKITIISHGLIDFSGSNLFLEPAAHGILAWTDQSFSTNATSIKLAGSNINVTSRAILFTPRSGQDVSGSNNATLCIQMIGQGSLKVAGSNSKFGPLAEGCAPPEVAPTLTLVKTVVNDNGGTATANDFQARINGNPVPWGVPQTLSAGSYTASEDLVPGYAPSAWGGDCAANGTVALAASENKTCTITNDDIAPELTVIKHVINDDGGTAVASNFTMNVAGTNVSQPSFPGAESPGTTVTLNAGSYNVTETGPSGYTASFSDDCSGTIAVGETKTCTVTNNDTGPTLTLVKIVTNNNGGTAQPSAWTLSASGDANGFSGSGPTVGPNSVTAGQAYTLSESGPAGYAASAWSCTGGTQVGDQVTLALADNVTCTITNDDITPTLTVIKLLDPNTDNGLLNLLIDGTVYKADAGHNDTTGPVAVNAGTHTVSETAGTGTDLSDYMSVIGGDCAANGSITLALAENKTCTITNTRKSTVEVDKTVSGTTSGAGYTFEIRTGASATEPGTTVASCTTDANGECNFSGEKFVPGDYQFCETAMLPGWHSSLSDDPNAFVPNSDEPDPDNSVVCIPFMLDPGETKLFNVDNTPPPDGDARTIGFWKNWSSCSGGNQDPVLDETLASFPNGGVLIGDLFVDTCREAVRLLNKSQVNNGKKMANDAAYGLAAQLLAAKLNIQAGAGLCSAASNAIAAGQGLLDTINFTGNGDYLGPKVKGTAAQQRAQALALAETLDQYNNNLLCQP